MIILSAVPPAPSPSKTSRYDTSLGLLTKRFVDLLQMAPDGTVDLNKVKVIFHCIKIPRFCD